MWVWRRIEEGGWLDEKTRESEMGGKKDECRSAGRGRGREMFGANNNEAEKELDRTCCTREQFVKADDRGKNDRKNDFAVSVSPSMTFFNPCSVPATIP